MVLTSHDQLGDTGRKTGFWLEEGAAPYAAFTIVAATALLAILGGWFFARKAKTRTSTR